MATNELYFSLELENYRKSKADILKSQADLLRILRNLNKLMLFYRQKKDLKKKLDKTFSSLKKKISFLEKKFPLVEVPDEFKKKLEKTFEPVKKASHKKNSPEKDRVEEELVLINDKLSELNKWL